MACTRGQDRDYSTCLRCLACNMQEGGKEERKTLHAAATGTSMIGVILRSLCRSIHSMLGGLPRIRSDGSRLITVHITVHLSARLPVAQSVVFTLCEDTVLITQSDHGWRKLFSTDEVSTMEITYSVMPDSSLSTAARKKRDAIGTR
jgi:hypothetical protein